MLWWCFTEAGHPLNSIPPYCFIFHYFQLDPYNAKLTSLVSYLLLSGQQSHNHTVSDQKLLIAIKHCRQETIPWQNAFTNSRLISYCISLSPLFLKTGKDPAAQFAIFEILCKRCCIQDCNGGHPQRDFKQRWPCFRHQRAPYGGCSVGQTSPQEAVHQK